MAIQDTDKFLVNRSGSSYQVEAQNLMATIADDDLMLVNRNNQSYKVTGAEVKEGLGGGGALPSLNVNDGFRIASYSGNASTRTFFSDLGDCRNGCFVWIRSRGQRGAWFFSSSWGNDQALDSKLTSGNPNNISNSVGFTSNGVRVGSANTVNANGGAYIIYVWKSTQGLFDMVSYSGNGTTRTISHNLGAKPKMMWLFSHTNSTYGWQTYFEIAAPNNMFDMATGSGTYGDDYWDGKQATPEEFYLNNSTFHNQSGHQYTAFIWGGSNDDEEYPIKTGSYTGTERTDPFTINTGGDKNCQIFMVKSITAGQNKAPIFHDKEQGFTGSGAQSWHVSNYNGLNLPGAVDFSVPGSVTVTSRDANINPPSLSGFAGTYAYMYVSEP